MTDDQRILGARISGRVQGVGFRAWTQGQARKLGLAGWVRNEPDGTVAAVFAGPPAAVAAMVEYRGQGPPDASVSAVETWDENLADLPPEFRVTR